jgi:hypothetical protein
MLPASYIADVVVALYACAGPKCNAASKEAFPWNIQVHLWKECTWKNTPLALTYLLLRLCGDAALLNLAYRSLAKY